MKIGKFGILVKRRTLIKSSIIITLVTWVYYIISSYSLSSTPSLQHLHIDNIKWTDFLRDCGKDAPMEKSFRNFEKHYKGKNVQMEGYVMRVDEYDDSEYFVSSILVMMQPRDMHSMDQNYAKHEPDLILQF